MLSFIISVFCLFTIVGSLIMAYPFYKYYCHTWTWCIVMIHLFLGFVNTQLSIIDLINHLASIQNKKGALGANFFVTSTCQDFLCFYVKYMLSTSQEYPA